MPTQDSALNSMAPKKVYKSSRRNRIPLSCEPCRSRKYLAPMGRFEVNALLTKLFRLRCNRERPCSNCTVRDERASCKYESPKNGSGTHHATKQGDSMQQRINHLEDLVKNLIAQKQKAPITADGVETGPSVKDSVSNTSESTRSPGKTVIDGGHSVYKGAEDWYDVLQEVVCILVSFLFVLILMLSRSTNSSKSGARVKMINLNTMLLLRYRTWSMGQVCYLARFSEQIK